MGLQNANGKTKRWQAWAICAPDAVSYRIQGRAWPRACSRCDGNYEGVVLSDGYAVYEALRKQRRGVLLAHCWAHVRRKFFEVEELQAGTCAEALDLIGVLFDVEHRGRDESICGDEITRSSAARE